MRSFVVLPASQLGADEARAAAYGAIEATCSSRAREFVHAILDSCENRRRIGGLARVVAGAPLPSRSAGRLGIRSMGDLDRKRKGSRGMH
jgi:hypothetical protein